MFASTPLPSGGEKRQKESDQWLSSDGDWSWSLESFGVVRDGIFLATAFRFGSQRSKENAGVVGADLGPGRGEEREIAVVAKMTLARAWLSIALLYFVVVFPLADREGEEGRQSAGRLCPEIAGGICRCPSCDAGRGGRGGEGREKQKKKEERKRKEMEGR